MKRDKVINYSSKTATNDTILNTIVNNSDTDKNLLAGEIAIITKTDDESLLIKNQGGNIVEFPAKGKINKAISDAIDVSVSGDTGVINTKIEQAITSANTYTDTQITKVTVKNADKSINVSPSDSGTTISVNVKSGDNALKLDNGGLYVDQSALTSYEGKEAILIADKSGVTGVKEIALKINANDKILSQTADGLLSTLSLAKVVSPATGMASQYQLVGKDGTAEGIENSLRTDVDSKVSGITASDTSITVDNTTTTNPKLKVTLSQTDGNRLALNADGLYVTNTIDCGTF